MAKSFRDLLATAGYRTERADNPTVLRERNEDGLGSGYSSESSGSDQGPTCLLQDDVNGKLVAGAQYGSAINNIRTQPKDIEGFVENPFITPTKDPVPTTVAEVTRRRDTTLPPPEEVV